jgi:trigger factor
MRPQAERQVKARLALETIAALEGVVASEDEINEEYQRIADAYHLEVAQVKGMLDDASIIADLQVKKAMDIVKESAVIKAE